MRHYRVSALPEKETVNLFMNDAPAIPRVIVKRKTKSKATIAVFNDAGSKVKCTYVKRDEAFHFRKKGSRKVNVITLRELYNHITGQIVMPFV